MLRAWQSKLGFYMIRDHEQKKGVVVGEVAIIMLLLLYEIPIMHSAKLK